MQRLLKAHDLNLYPNDKEQNIEKFHFCDIHKSKNLNAVKLEFNAKKEKIDEPARRMWEKKTQAVEC